jgi:phosphatidylglycerol lysyltransferase
MTSDLGSGARIKAARLAVGLTQRVKLAWRASLAVLVAGAAFLALHDAPIWIPLVLLLGAAVLAPFPRVFYRHASLLGERLHAGTVMPLVTLVLCVGALASFEPRLHWLDSNSFWEVILSPDEPNTLKLSLALFLGLGMLALWLLMRPARVASDAWDAAARVRFAQTGAKVPATADGVVWGEDGGAGIAFRRIGRILLALGDPVGDAEDRVSAIWRLRDLARQEGLDPAVWRAGSELLEIYADMGLAALPLGPDGLPVADAEDAPGPHAKRFLVCIAERDLGQLLPILPTLV